MAAYDTLLLVLVAPSLWWVMAMVRAVMDVRARAVAVTEWDGSEELTAEFAGPPTSYRDEHPAGRRTGRPPSG